VPEDSEINSGATISIAATATDTENDAMTYLWQQTAGANISLTTTTSLTTSFIAPASAGEITLSFTATDSKGLSSTQNVTFTVVVAPIATPSPTPPVESKSSGGGSIGYFILFIVILLTRKQIK
jgi:hypothetical protein